MAEEQGPEVVVNAPRLVVSPGGPRWWSVFLAPEWGLLAAIAGALGAIYLLEPTHGFFGAHSLKNLYHMLALYGVLAVGAAVVIIAGGIDLSVGSVVALSAVVAARLLTEWLPGARPASGPLPWWLVGSAVGLTLLLGMAIGLLHALMINQFRLPPFIATLATMAGLRSVAIVLSKNRTINVPSDSFRFLGHDNRYAIPLAVSVALLASVVMGATVLGRHLYALGGNEAAARLSGLRTQRLKAVAYATSGMLAGLAGILFAGDNGMADSRMGMTYELFAITAAVVGGCSLSGGVGSIRGTVLGLILIRIVIQGTGLVVKGIEPSQIEGIVLGTVVVLAVAFNQRFRVDRN